MHGIQVALDTQLEVINNNMIILNNEHWNAGVTASPSSDVTYLTGALEVFALCRSFSIPCSAEWGSPSGT